MKVDKAIGNSSNKEALRTVAVFDFDGTLTRRDSLFPFLRMVGGMFRYWWGLLLLSPTLMRYALHLTPNWKAKEAVLTYFLSGLKSEKLHQLGQRFAVQQIPKLIRPEALQRLRWHQEQGHQTILVSSSLEVYLSPWAEMMGLSQVIGTQLVSESGRLTGRILGKNCYGREKVNRLTALLGDLKGYCLYAYGDSPGDRELLDCVDYPYYRKFQDAAAAGGSTKFPYLTALRPRQWTKNLIVFAAPLFAFSINLQSLVGSLVAFGLFCCASSSFYLLNDLKDVESDRQHPIKCQRPIAAGLVSIPVAIAMAVLLLGSALILGWLRSPALGVTLTGYALLQVAYNLRLKHTPILDIVTIATGFVLRAYAGFAATGIVLSNWFLLCTAMLALFLGVEKRKAELRVLEIRGGKTRAVLEHYSLPLLLRMESTVTTGAVMSYAIWSSGPQVNGASTPLMMLTLPFVLYGIFRYQLLSDLKETVQVSDAGLNQGKETERPEEVLLTDLPILFTVLGWIVAIFIILLLKNRGLIG